MLQAAACCMLLHVLQAAFAHLQSLLNCVFRSLPAATVAGSAQAGRGEGGLGSMTGPQGLWAWQGQVLLRLGLGHFNELAQGQRENATRWPLCIYLFALPLIVFAFTRVRVRVCD